MSAFAFLALALCGVPAPPQDGARCAPLRAGCHGPMSGFEVSWPDGNRARVRLALGAGETREVVVPLPLPAAPDSAEPLLTIEGAGSVELALADLAGARDGGRQRLPAGLRLRSVPATLEAAGGMRLPWPALCAAGACLAVVAHLRSRPLRALGAGALGAVLALSLARSARPAAIQVEVLEGDGTAWVLARAAHSRLDLEAPASEHLESHPREAVLQVEGDGRVWTVSAPGARLTARRVVGDIDARVLWGANAFEDLPRCWVRSAQGHWSHRGPWRRGEPLPEPSAGPAPPAALIAGLPPGRALLLAERIRGEAAGRSSAWLRLVGMPDPASGPAATIPPRH